MQLLVDPNENEEPTQEDLKHTVHNYFHILITFRDSWLSSGSPASSINTTICKHSQNIDMYSRLQQMVGSKKTLFCNYDYKITMRHICIFLKLQQRENCYYNSNYTCVTCS